MLVSVMAALQPVFDVILTALYPLWELLNHPGANPLSWNAETWSLVGFLSFLLIFLVRRWTRQSAPHPELIISAGDIVQMENSVMQRLSFKISNLGELPVQLLELSLRSNLVKTPIFIEAVELLPPQEVVELEATLPTELIGDTGRMHAYAYVARRGSRIYVLRAQLLWEPWKKRFKISPKNQTLRRARRLVSENLRQAYQHAWQNQNPHLGRVTPPSPTFTLSGKEPPSITRNMVKAKTRRPADLDFPNEF